MKWINDKTGRFPHRPYFEDQEIDYECEELITSFLLKRYGKVAFPIPTDDLTVLIEQHTSKLDIYADLSQEGESVEGMTVFSSKERPQVFIQRDLSETPNKENRFRTTLTHELGHVKLHGFLLSGDQMSLFENQSRPTSIQGKCKRDSILNAPAVDWMEWQAGYASGAFLMPISYLRELVQDALAGSQDSSQQTIASLLGQAIIHQVQSRFQVSEDAARVRLIKCNFLSEKRLSMPLFPTK